MSKYKFSFHQYDDQELWQLELYTIIPIAFAHHIWRWPNSPKENGRQSIIVVVALLPARLGALTSHYYFI